jgi:hypothetical protein
MMNHSKFSGGQTLIEIVVTLSVVIGLTSLLIMYNRTGQRIARLPRAAERLVFDIRKAQDYALTVREFAPGEVPCAYGVNFQVDTDTYTIFADRAADCVSANGVMDPGEAVEVIRMEEGVVVQASNISTARFVPPSANTAFLPPGVTVGRITLALRDDPTFRRTVTISSLGQVSLE